MTKPQLIKKIKENIVDCGSFFAGEVNSELGEGFSPSINEMGDLVALAEYFTEDEVEVNVYDTSSSGCDPIHTYRVKYNHIPKFALEYIYIMAKSYAREQLSQN